MQGRIVSLFRNLLHKDAVEQALDDELQATVQLLTDDKVIEGFSSTEARRQALIELGCIENVKGKVREVRIGRLMEDFVADLRFGFRSLAKSPGVSVAIIVSLALGIAANATVFSVANGLLWGVLPIREPGRMVMFSEGKSFSFPDYLDYREQTADIFEGGVVAHFDLVPASLGSVGEPERVWGQVVGGNYFSVLGVNMALGRPILEEEDRSPRSGQVVVLSHNLWQRHFNSDAGILGREVVLNGLSYTVVGIAPAGFHGSERGIVSDFWVPLSMVNKIIPGLATPEGGSGDRVHQWLMLNARLKPGVSRAQAVTALNLVKKRLDDTYRKDDKRHEAITLQKASGLIAGSVTPAYALTAILMLVGTLVLLVACANVANLALTRAAGRRKEMGVRLAMGAGRGRLIRQLLTESLLLAIAGAGMGLLLAAVVARALSNIRLPLPIPVAFDFNVNWRVVLFTVGLSVLTALLFGLWPALRATRLELTGALKESAAATGHVERSRMRNTLVIVQVALSLVLLAAAGLFLRSMQNAVSIDIGFNPDNILVTRVDPQIQNYSAEKIAWFLSSFRDRVSALPGVRSVSFVDLVPLSLAHNGSRFDAEAARGLPAQSVNADFRSVFSGYFKTMGIPFLSGRDFDSQLKQQDTAIIINETMAAHLFPGQDPIGRAIHSGKVTYTVIGVVRNTKSRTVGEGSKDCAYFFLNVVPGSSLNLFGISALIKTVGDPLLLDRPIRDQIAALDPNLAVFDTETMEEQVSDSLLLPRMSACLLGCFGAVGLTLGAIGLYGVMSYSVRRRTHEIGVRMAMGARPGAVITMVVRQGLALTCAGLMVGLAIALAVGRLCSSLLYGVSGADPVTYLVVSGVLVTAALAAIIVPAYRASQVNPVVALRNE
jgi:predicted permease